MTKWTKDSYFGFQYTTEYRGYKISRTTCNSGTKLYYVHCVTYPHYAAPHWYMSDKMYSLQRAKRIIDTWVDDGIHFTVAELRIIKNEQHRIDTRYNLYDDAWCSVREQFDAQFEQYKSRY